MLLPAGGATGVFGPGHVSIDFEYFATVAFTSAETPVELVVDDAVALDPLFESEPHAEPTSARPSPASTLA
jgi:hypothetical protein